MTKLRKLTIIDNTASINLTLWGKYAEKWNKSDLKNSVIVIKGCKINGYGGRSLSASNNIKIAVEYIQEAQELKNWFKYQYINKSIKLINLTVKIDDQLPYFTINEVDDIQSSMKQENDDDYFMVSATVIVINDNNKSKDRSFSIN